MKRTALARRALAGFAGVALGIGGVALASTPAQAEDMVRQENGRYLIDCQTLTVSPDKRDQFQDAHAWRVLFLLPDQNRSDGEVVWQSGDWELDADLGDDAQALIDAGWAVPDFEVQFDLEGVPNGMYIIEYWDTTRARPQWRQYTQGVYKFERKYEQPCGWVPQPEITEGDCEVAASITLPERLADDQHQDKALTYIINDEPYEPGTYELEPGTYEVIVIREGGEKDYTKTWVFEVPEIECEEPGEDEGEGGELPVTGTTATLIAAGAVLLLALGTGAYLIARRRRVTFTA